LELKTLIDQEVITPVVDKRFPLAELPDALRLLVQGHAQGKIVIKV